MSKRPNIVLFNPDHYRGEAMGHAGNPCVSTPHVDGLVANSAVSFSHAFCQSPVCTPSRCSFMSGWYPHVAGHRTMHHLMQPGDPVLLRTLKEAGYFVWWGGKNDLVAGQHGYDDYCDVKFQAPGVGGADAVHAEPPPGWRGDPDSDGYFSFFVGELEIPPGETLFPDHDLAMVRGAIDQLDDLPPEQPFCMYLPLLNPHPPLGVEEPFFSQVDRDLVPPRIRPPADYAGKPSMMRGIAENARMSTWDEARWNELRAVHYGMCNRIDHLFGMLLAALEKQGLMENTLVIFFSDHGMYAGDFGLVDINQNTFDDVLTRVPLVIKPPAGHTVASPVHDAMVELVDLSATILDYADIELDWPQFGRSLRPLIDGSASTHRDAVFCEGGRLHGERQAMELEYPPGHQDPTDLYYPRLSLQAGNGPEHGKAVMCRTRDWKYVYRLYEDDELYDLRTDPGEVSNRITDPDLAPIITELRNRTLQFMVSTADAVPMKPDQRW